MSSEFYRSLPKVELHAHLNGSVTRQCLQQIWEDRKRLEPDYALEAPVIALADERTGQDISTFFGHFNTYIYHLISCPNALEYATASVLKDFANDGVVYLELRTTPRALPQTPFSGALTSADAIQLILAVISRWNASDTRMQVGLILTIDQAKHSMEEAINIVNLALQLRDVEMPVVGVDLAGDPQARRDLTRFRPAFDRARNRQLPITLHFAEIPVSSSRPELEELLSWGPRRLGHVIHVPPDLAQQIIEQNIAVELCLTCNVLANMLPAKDGQPASFVDHHFRWWHSQPCSLSINTDDVGVFGSTSSEEHELAAKHFNLDKSQLIDISRRALGGAFASDDVKSRVGAVIEEFATQHGA